MNYGELFYELLRVLVICVSFFVFANSVEFF